MRGIRQPSMRVTANQTPVNKKVKAKATAKEKEKIKFRRTNQQEVEEFYKKIE